MTDELEPVFLVRVHLDGDDDPATQTTNALNQLRAAVAGMRKDGWIIDGAVTQANA